MMPTYAQDAGWSNMREAVATCVHCRFDGELTLERRPDTPKSKHTWGKDQPPQVAEGLTLLLGNNICVACGTCGYHGAGKACLYPERGADGPFGWMT